MNILVSRGTGEIVERRPVEIVERKGRGHPDTLCDKAAEELSIVLSKYYIEKFDRVQHHNVDKVLLVGGQSDVGFGYGEVIEPIYILMSGRAVSEFNLECGTITTPVGRFSVEHTRRWIQDELPHLNVESDLIVDYKIRTGSTDLVGNFDSKMQVPKSNDTSFGVGYGPLSPTENLVLETELLLNDKKTKRTFPQIGEDIKVMGTRIKDKIHLQIAAAIISDETEDEDKYMSVMEKIREMSLKLSSDITDMEVEISVNTADEPENGLFYLTTTGTSAEHGDDGQVGRGNRINGLITPYRPMTLEASCGKNPVSHVGKTYNVAARKIVDRLLEQYPDTEQVYCYIVSQIGAPITEPKALNIEIYGNNIEDAKKTSRDIAFETMAELPDIWRRFIDRQYQLW